MEVRFPFVGIHVDIHHTDVVFMADSTAESRTRERVRRAVGERGPVSASQLARDLGLTPAAVRRHLDALSEAGLIAEGSGGPRKVRGRGRPARSYVLTEHGQDQLGTRYDDVAVAALRRVEQQGGPGAVQELAEDHIGALEERLQATVAAAGSDVGARTEALAEALSGEGFAASTRAVGEGSALAGIQLCQGHCPVRNVATDFRQFCDAETEAISRLLGVHVQRLATLAGGEHVCTTFVPTGALSSSVPAEGTAPDQTIEGRSSR